MMAEYLNKEKVDVTIRDVLCFDPRACYRVLQEINKIPAIEMETDEDEVISFEDMIDILFNIKNMYTWNNYTHDALQQIIAILDTLNRHSDDFIKIFEQKEKNNGCN